MGGHGDEAAGVASNQSVSLITIENNNGTAASVEEGVANGNNNDAGKDLLDKAFELLEVASQLEKQNDTRMKAVSKYNEAISLMKGYVEMLPNTPDQIPTKNLLNEKISHYERVVKNHSNNTLSVAQGGGEVVSNLRLDGDDDDDNSSTVSATSFLQSFRSKIQQLVSKSTTSVLGTISTITTSSSTTRTEDHDTLTEPLLVTNGEDANENNNNNNTNNIGNGPQNLDIDTSSTSPDKYALAYSPTTNLSKRILFCVWVLATHVIFLYGQTAPMWKLKTAVNVDVWANATSFTSRATFSELGLDNELHIRIEDETVLQTFTYAYGVKQLWRAHRQANKFLPRLAAALLVLASGVWPHLKLFLIQICWFFPIREKFRTRYLYWLGALGKWTLADVFVVCVMIGVVNLDWNIDPAVIKQGTVEELPMAVDLAKQMYTPLSACNNILHLTCAGDVNWQDKAKCWACEAAIGKAFDHPDWAQGVGKEILKGVDTSGDGLASMRIAGMHGIYAYCAAVMLSLLLGVFVDVSDHKSRLWSCDRRRTGGVGENGSAASSVENDPDFYNPERHQCVILRKRAPVVSVPAYILLIMGACVTTFLVALASVDDVMERRVNGAFPTIIQDVLGIDWTQGFSLKSLAHVTGAAKGWDYLLMGTFLIFIVLGPTIRGILCVIFLVAPLKESQHHKLLTAINFVGSFCAWEVFTAAVFMVGLEMPSQTNTIIHRNECKHLSEDGSCLEVQFNMLTSYGLVLLAGCLLSFIAILSIKLGYIGLDPYHDGDEGGPYGIGQLCCGDKDDHEDTNYENTILIATTNQRPMSQQDFRYHELRNWGLDLSLQENNIPNAAASDSVRFENDVQL